MENQLPKQTTRKLQKNSNGYYINLPILIAKHYNLTGEELIKIVPQENNKLTLEIIRV